MPAIYARCHHSIFLPSFQHGVGGWGVLKKPVVYLMYMIFLGRERRALKLFDTISCEVYTL